MIVFFLATFCFSCFESTLPLVVSDNFHLDIQSDVTTSASTVAYLFVFCGLIGAIVQGGAIGPMVKRFGEPRLIAVSLVLTAISLALLPFIKGPADLSWGVLVPARRTRLAGDARGIGAPGGRNQSHSPAAVRNAIQPDVGP